MPEADIEARYLRAAIPLFAAAFDHLPAVVAELVLLAGKTIANVSATAFDSGAELSDIVAAGSPVARTVPILRKRRGRE